MENIWNKAKQHWANNKKTVVVVAAIIVIAYIL